jgi:CubicO group peptidase (beta-lactamase class C family)
MSRIDERLMHELFTEAVSRSGAVGAQLSIAQGEERLDLAVGLADARRGVPMTTETLMQIGSITKVFNATLVMSLVDEGRLALDDPIERYLPRIQIAEPNATSELTLRHLLSMTSGLDNGPYVYFGRGDDALGRYVGALGALPRHFPPGQHFGYSNAGACVAGWVASRAAGVTWERLLRKRILAPARLQHAAIADEDVGEQVVSLGHLASGEDDAPRIVLPQFLDLRARAPSGPSFALSTSDLARFGAALARGGVADSGAQLLSGPALNQMLSPEVATPVRKYGTAWCLGPCMATWGENAVWGHGGTSPTATAYLYWIPAQRGVIAFVVNTHAAMGELSRVVFDEIVPAVFGCSKPRIDVLDKPSGGLDKRRYVGRYEELGMTMEVRAGEGDTLRAHILPRPIRGEIGVTRMEQRSVLRPLGGDRFLVDPADGPDRHRGVVDTAFFGDDGAGRATNVLNLVFPMSRRPR